MVSLMSCKRLQTCNWYTIENILCQPVNARKTDQSLLEALQHCRLFAFQMLSSCVNKDWHRASKSCIPLIKFASVCKGDEEMFFAWAFHWACIACSDDWLMQMKEPIYDGKTDLYRSGAAGLLSWSEHLPCWPGLFSGNEYLWIFSRCADFSESWFNSLAANWALAEISFSVYCSLYQKQ